MSTLTETKLEQVGAHTIYKKSIRDPSSNKTPILKPANSNSKLGKGANFIVKGKWRGYPLYSLTLEERATCPDTCYHWSDCYGNNMPFAHRFSHGPDLEKRLWIELYNLSRVHPNGFVIRLHVLGDFYSIDYVRFWLHAMAQFDSLFVFGYTSRADEIWEALQVIRLAYPERWWIRQSSGKQWDKSDPLTIYAGTEKHDGIVCPEQTGKTQSCLTCGLCWSVNKTIVFKDH